VLVATYHWNVFVKQMSLSLSLCTFVSSDVIHLELAWCASCLLYSLLLQSFRGKLLCSVEQIK